MSDNLDKLDFDISYDIIFGKEEVDLIDIYEPKAMTMEVDLPDDEFVTFSSDLIKCFRSKIKEGEHKVKVDTLIEVYRNAEVSYDQSKNYSLSLWCMASVNAFLGIVEASNFDAAPSAEQIENAEKDLGEFELILDFASIKDLYLETRREALAERSDNWVEI
jgi:dsDNA-binding SOS-regulon protein